MWRGPRGRPPGLGIDAVASPGELKATPEMWFYDQAMRQYKDPKMAVRAKAEFRASNGMRRLESMKWFGFSNSRPARQQRSVPRRLLAGLDLESGLLSVAWNGVGPTAFYYYGYH